MAISSAFPFEMKKLTVHGRTRAYVEVGGTGRGMVKVVAVDPEGA